MKLSNLTAKLTSLKSRTVKILAATALAGAALTAAVPAAQAQRVYFGFGYGGPRYYAPPPPVYYGGYGYYHPGFRYYYHPYYHRWGWYR